ncbi:MAG: cytochrome P450 [Solirubrobacteraceae bacterium]
MSTKTQSLAVRIKGELPPSGHLPAALQTAGCRWFAYRYFEAAQRRFGDRFSVYPLDMPPLVFLSDPDDIRAVLTADPQVLHPGAGSAILTPLIGARSFMLLEEDEHVAGRRAINPAFHQRVIAHHTSILLDTIEHEIATWPTDTSVALHPLIRSLTLRVILRAIFGEHESVERLHTELIPTLNISTSFLLQEPRLRRLPGWRSSWQTFTHAQAKVDELLYELVRERRCQANREPADLVDLLLGGRRSDGSPMPDSEIRDNLMSMILAGHETTTGELSWAFQLLAQHQDVQRRLHDEIAADNDDDEAYLTAAVNETMRRRPVFLFVIPREVMEPLEIGGWLYQPPAHLAGCTYLMHHNPDIYPRPFEFRPERFLEEPPQPRTWLPWGGGKKHCLGRHFALLEVKTILRHVLAENRVLPASQRLEPPRWRSAILVPGHGCRVVLSRRAGNTRAFSHA